MVKTSCIGHRYRRFLSAHVRDSSLFNNPVSKQPVPFQSAQLPSLYQLLI